MADFILNEAFEESDDYKLVFSDDSNDEYLEEEEQHQDFICDDSLDEQQDASFYREVNFCMQITNPVELINECDDEYCGDDDLSERFDPENRQDVEFNVFEKSSTLSKKFKESLVGFKNANNQFFMVFFMEFYIIKITAKILFLKTPNKLWEVNSCRN